MKYIERTWHIHNTSDIPIQHRLLQGRGIDENHIDSFLSPALSDLADPFLFHDMQKAVVRVQHAINKQERIMVFGDYDVDGVTGTAILVRTLLKLGASVSYRLPHRVHDGYGLKKHIIDDIAEKKTSLLITVDNGIASIAEIAHAQNKGIDAIITDHHTVPDIIPSALAILHPKQKGQQYPFQHLSGSGVAFMFSKALMRYIAHDQQDVFVHNMLDIVMLGTIADCVPLVGENRVLAWHGLRQLKNTTHPGLQHLMHIAGVTKDTINTHTVEYMLAPRLNAGGRMATALDALHLFLFEQEKAEKIAEKLHHLNSERQQETIRILEEAEKKLEQKHSGGIIVVEGDWHIGVIGIVASRLAEKYYVPTIVLGKKGDTFVASCRSEGETNMIDLLSHYKNFFIHFGGHEGAAGFDIPADQLDGFKKEICSMANQSDSLVPQKNMPLFIETTLNGPDLSWGLLSFLDQMAPYGEQNPEPLFAFLHTTIKDHRLVGNDKHAKFLLDIQGVPLEAIVFNAPDNWKIFSVGDRIDVAGKLKKNEFNGNKKISLVITDIKS